MAKAAAPAADGAEAPKKGGRKKLVLLALPLLLAGIGGGLWFAGLLPFGGSAESHAAAEAHGAPGGGQPGGQGAAHGGAQAAPARPPVFLDLPEILTNLNAPGRRATFIRLKAKLELAGEADAAAIQAAMPRLLDLFQTYLREMRPEELRGSQGTWRLREELRARAAIAASPARINDILFVEMIVQ